MSFIEEHLGKLIAAVLALITAAITWIVRTVFTNNKKVELLEQHIQDNNKRLDERHSEIQNSILKVEKQNEVALDNQQRFIEVLLTRLEKLNEPPTNK